MAEIIDFTIRTIEAIKPPAEGRLEFKDSKTPGLYLRVTASGIKTFSFVGRAKGAARVERVTFGKFPTVKPDEARRKATVLAGELAGGTSAAAASRQRRGEMSVAELFKLYKESLTARDRKSVDEIERRWEALIQPAFGTRRLSDVTGLDVERWHRALPAQIVARREQESRAKREAAAARRAQVAARQTVRRHGPDPKPRPATPLVPPRVTGQTSANRAVETLRAMYNWAGEPKRAIFTGVNPAARHELFAEVERERFIQPDELGPFFQALAEEPNEDIRDFVLCAVLTGARRSNVIAMRWDELSLKRGEWRVSGELMKNGQPQTITLTPELVELLKARAEKHKGEWVFESSRSKSGHMTEPHSGWTRILKRANLDDLRIHDLRRTLGSWLARTGASLVLIGKSLNHKSQQATAIYARLDLDPIRQSVNLAASAMLEAAGAKEVAKVLQFPATRADEGSTGLMKPGRSGRSKP
ncbi:MAG: site-specific integrase [Burkholderiaceae bacterium]|nr:site-specific integrase [Burkholderiaceae bacterium]